MGTQEKPRRLDATSTGDTKLRDGPDAERLQNLHHFEMSQTFAPADGGGLRACKPVGDTAPAHQNTNALEWRLLQQDDVPTGLPEYEAFFKVTLSDGARVNLLAPKAATWEGDVAAHEAVKFIEDPAAELEAFLLAFARSQ